MTIYCTFIYSPTPRRSTDLVAPVRATLIRRMALKANATAVVAPWRFG